MRLLTELKGKLRRMIVRSVQRLPDGVVLEILGSLSLIKRMDYERSDLFLNVESPEEYFSRLGSCRKEPETVEWIENDLAEGEVLYDVGANIGAYTLIASKVAGGKAKVYSFEPASANYAKLCQNVQLNGSQANVVALPIALSDATKFSPLVFSNTNPGVTARLGEAESGQVEQIVPIWKLDELRTALGMEPPNLMKIDVDGAELSVLRGAKETLRNRALRAVQVELETDQTVPNYSIVVKELEDAGFELHRKYPHFKYSNYLFVRNGSTTN